MSRVKQQVQLARSLSAAEISRGTVEVVANIGIDQVLLSGAQHLGKSGACVPSLHMPATILTGLQSNSSFSQLGCKRTLFHLVQQSSSEATNTCTLSSFLCVQVQFVELLSFVALRIESTQQRLLKHIITCTQRLEAYQLSPKQTCQICWACNKQFYKHANSMRG